MPEYPTPEKPYRLRTYQDSQALYDAWAKIPRADHYRALAQELRSGRWTQIRGTYGVHSGHLCKRCAVGVAIEMGMFGGLLSRKLVKMNDVQQKTFPEIADWLDAKAATMEAKK